VIALGLAVLCVPGAGAQDAVPSGWMLGGAGYQAGLDREIRHGGAASAFLRSGTGSEAAFGTLMQAVGVGDYGGRRVRLSGFCRAGAVTGWAGLWLRVDGPSGPLAMDNMQSRPIKGTSAWTEHAVVLDVPAQATGLAFGVLLAGQGQIWIDDLQLEVVDETVAVTGGPLDR
jgi:hypothetical protein